MKRKDEFSMARGVLMAEVSRRRVLRRLGLRWTDGGSRGMTVEAERQCAKDRTKRRSLVLKQKIEFDH